MSALYCYSCGHQVPSGHINDRFRRLELASQYRPIHIGVLFLNDSPPPALDDFFYSAAGADTSRSPSSRAFFDSLMTAVGIAAEEGNLPGRRDETALLSEFQHRGCFLADAFECPPHPSESVGNVPGSTSVGNEIGREHWPTLLKRIQLSYKPRKIVLLSQRTRSLIPMFKEAGLADRLLLHRGGSLDLPIPGDSKSTVGFIVQLGNLVRLSDSSLQP
jgi:hypothetical protein